MTFDEAVAALQASFPQAPIAATAAAGQYQDRARRIDNFERRSDWLFVGHGVNGKEMWIYYSEHKKAICCGDKDTN